MSFFVHKEGTAGRLFAIVRQRHYLDCLVYNIIATPHHQAAPFQVLHDGPRRLGTLHHLLGISITRYSEMACSYPNNSTLLTSFSTPTWLSVTPLRHPRTLVLSCLLQRKPVTNRRTPVPYFDTA